MSKTNCCVKCNRELTLTELRKESKICYYCKLDMYREVNGNLEGIPDPSEFGRLQEDVDEYIAQSNIGVLDNPNEKVAAVNKVFQTPQSKTKTSKTADGITVETYVKYDNPIFPQNGKRVVTVKGPNSNEDAILTFSIPERYPMDDQQEQMVQMASKQFFKHIIQYLAYNDLLETPMGQMLAEAFTPKKREM